MKVRKTSGDDSMLEVQMAPLIDCVFLLLVFFLVATTMKKTQPGIEVALPQSSTEAFLVEDSNTLSIGIDSSGQLYLGLQPVGKEALKNQIRESAQSDPPAKVRIYADQDTDYLHVVEVVELCQYEGLNVIGFRLGKE